MTRPPCVNLGLLCRPSFRLLMVPVALLLPLLLSRPTADAEGRLPAGSKELNLTEVEVADGPREMARGLMYRRELCRSCGMVFVYPEARIRSFWMRNTLLPLDMIFMESSGRIVDIHESTVPLREVPPYSSRSPVSVVLEVNAGFAGEGGLKVGDVVDLKSLWEKSVDFRWVEPWGKRDN